MLEESAGDDSSRHPSCPTCGVAMWMVKIEYRTELSYADRKHYECKACDAKAVMPPLERGAMSNVTDLFQQSTFNHETINILDAAYEKARKSLHDKGQPPVVQEIIAARIIAAAQTGERNPDKLCELALTALGNKAVFER